MAQGGTLFLDEIGTLKPELQGKLLRVVQEREIERVGGTRTIRIDHTKARAWGTPHALLTTEVPT